MNNLMYGAPADIAAFESDLSAAAAATIGGPRVKNLQLDPYTPAEKSIIGHLPLKSTPLKGTPEVHYHPVIHRPPETARYMIRRLSEKDDQWRPQPTIIGAAYRCSGCGDPFGKSVQLTETESVSEPAARYIVLNERGRQEPVYFCLRAAECNARMKARLASRKKWERILPYPAFIPPPPKEPEIDDDPDIDFIDEEFVEGISRQADAALAHRVAVEALGDDAPLPAGWKRCALPSCNEPFRPYTPATLCCTSIHGAALKSHAAAHNRQAAIPKPVKYQRIGSSKKRPPETQARFDNRAAKAKAEAEAEDADGEDQDGEV